MTIFDIFMTIASGAFIIFNAWAFMRLIKLDENRIKDYFDNHEFPDIVINIEQVNHNDDNDSENESKFKNLGSEDK